MSLSSGAVNFTLLPLQSRLKRLQTRLDRLRTRYAFAHGRGQSRTGDDGPH
jgi:hypothetical protein